MLLLLLFSEIFIKTWPRFVGKPGLSTKWVCVVFLILENGTTVLPLIWIRKLLTPHKMNEVWPIICLNAFNQLSFPLLLDSQHPSLLLKGTIILWLWIPFSNCCLRFAHSSVILDLNTVPPPLPSGQFVIQTQLKSGLL